MNQHSSRVHRSPSLRFASSLLLCAAALLYFGLSAAFAGPARPAPDAAGGNRTIGAGKCMNCHKSDASGNQYAKWMESKHAHAFEALGTDAAKEAGKARGVEDPQKAAECLKCHVTAYGAAEDTIAKGFKPELGVQCESCHGAGEDHMKARVAAAFKAGEGGEVAPVAAGEILANPGMDTCVKCHNKESPSYKPFCFRKRLAEIQHLNPKKTRTDEERTALMAACGCAEDCKCDGTTVDPACTSAGGK